MANEIFDPKLPKGFHYSVKKGEMIIHFFCDCCKSEISVSKRLVNDNEDTYGNLIEVAFNDLKKELDEQFHRCDNCHMLICQDCWNKRLTRCSNCPLCFVKV